jgi:hypothetical protein
MIAFYNIFNKKKARYLIIKQIYNNANDILLKMKKLYLKNLEIQILLLCFIIIILLEFRFRLNYELVILRI